MPDLSAGVPGLGWVAAYLLVAAIVLVLLGIVLRLARRSNGGEVARKAPPARRLSVLDQIALDEKRRLVLIQRDGVQHLVILGGANELLVESGIGAARAQEHRDLRAPEPAREVPELPAFPAAPTRDAPAHAAPSIELAGRQPGFTAPTPPAFAEPPPRRAAAAEAPAPARPMPSPPAPSPRSEPVRPQAAPPQPVAPAPVARRAEPIQPAPAAPVTPPAPMLPPVPQPVLRAEPEPVRAAEAPPAAPSPASEPKAPGRPAAAEPAAIEPESPASVAETAKAGGLLSRLRRSRQGEPAFQAEASPEPALTPLPDPEPAVGEPRLAARDRLVSLRDPEPVADEPRLAVDQPDLLPEMPAHSVPEVMLDPSPVREPEPPPSAAPVAARREPDMSKLFDAIVPEAPAAPVRPAAAPPVAAREETPAGDPAETPRVAVKIDPFFANMAQRLEETLRRPIPPGTPAVAPPRPATNAAEIERVIDLALSAPEEPSKVPPAPAPVVNPPTPGAPTQDELEAEMANLLGRSHR